MVLSEYRIIINIYYVLYIIKYNLGIIIELVYRHYNLWEKFVAKSCSNHTRQCYYNNYNIIMINSSLLYVQLFLVPINGI